MGLTFSLQSSIENATLIIAATIPTLKPLLSRTRKASRAAYSGNNTERAAKRSGVSSGWRLPRSLMGTTQLPSVDSDHIELTGRLTPPEGPGADIQVFGKSLPTHATEPPDRGIMRGVETGVAF